MKKKSYLTAAAVAVLVAGLAAQSEAGTVAIWSGSGSSGADPYGESWVLNNAQFDGDGAWGMPGLFQGTLVWSGPSISDLHLVFVLPDGVDIDPNPVPTGPSGSDESTRFSNLSDSVLWNRTISGDSVDFVAAGPGDALDFGETFFVNVAFTGAVDPGQFSFEARYTNDAVVPLPPAGWLGLGMLALLGGARKLRRRDR